MKCFPGILCIVFCFLILSPAVGYTAESGQGNDIIVEAEGIGETKLKALKAAWMEAVRLGIGMYLTAKTTVIDEDIKEELVAHSRGRVNAYEVLSEKKGDDGWTVSIRAKIEKDVLQEAAVEAQSKSSKISDQEREKLKNAVATQESNQGKLQTAEELLDSFIFPENLADFFIFDFKNRVDNGKMYIDVFLSVNMEMYNKIFLKELKPVLDGNHPIFSSSSK
jgi:hypothetical protein